MSESVRVETAAGHCVSCGERTCAAAEPATAAAGDSFSEREEREEEEDLIMAWSGCTSLGPTGSHVEHSALWVF